MAGARCSFTLHRGDGLPSYSQVTLASGVVAYDETFSGYSKSTSKSSYVVSSGPAYSAITLASGITAYDETYATWGLGIWEYVIGETSGVTLLPATGSLSLAPATPVVIVPITLGPTAATLTLAPGTPVLSIPVLLTPAPGTISLIPGTPLVIIPITLSPTTNVISLSPGTPIVRSASYGVYRWKTEGASPTHWGGAVLPPVDPAPTIGHYGYEDFE